MTMHAPARPARRPAARQLPMTRARAVTLLVAVPVLVALIGWTALSAAGLAGRGSYHVRVAVPVRGGQVTARLDAGPSVGIQVGTSATLTVRQGGPAGSRTAELTGTMRYSLFRPHVTGSGGTLHYSCPVVGCSLDATLQVPRGVAVSAATSGGDLTVPGFAGSRIALATEGGDLAAGDLAGQADLSTSGGDLSATSVSGALQASTGGGDVRVAALTSPAAKVSSSGGDVTLAYASAPDSLQVSSGGGDVTVTLPRAQYQVNISSGGGDVHNDAGDDASAGRTVTIDSGGGDVTIRLAG